MTAWNPKDNSIRLRISVYIEILGSLQQAMGTKLSLSMTFHPHTNGQSERTIQILEDMLRACVLDFGGSWSEYLLLVEFL